MLVRMTRFGIPALSAAILASGFALSAPLVTAPVANANCGSGAQWDPVTANCWTVQDRNSLGAAYGAQGCRPGELGNCRAARQNGVRPGATLRSPIDSAPLSAPRSAG